MQLCRDINARVDDKAGQSKGETKSDKGESQACEIRRETEDQEHDGTGNVGSNSVQVGLDSAVAEALDNDGKVEGNSLQRHTKTDLDQKNDPRGGVLENLRGITEVELFGNNRRRVDLESVVSQFLLLGCEEAGRGAVEGEIPEGKGSHNERASALNNKEVLPGGQGTTLNLEGSKSEQTGEGTGDALAGVENGKTAGQLTTAVKGGLVVDDQGEEGTLRHAEEPTDGKQTRKVVHGSSQEGHGAENHHHARENARRAELLSNETQNRRREDVGDKEDG